VSRYDGREFASLTKADGLPHDTVLSLAEDGEGTLWLLTQLGLARVAPTAGPAGEPRVLALPPALAAINGADLQYLDAGGDAVWVISRGGLLRRFRAGRLATWDLSAALGGQPVGLGPVDSSAAWVVAAARVLRLREGAAPEVFSPAAGLGAAVDLAAHGGNLLLLQAEGLARLDGRGAFVPALEWQLPRGVPMRALVPFGEQLVAITEGADGFFLLTRGAAPRHFTSAQGLPSDMLSAAAVDRDGIL
jgi:hypothetical protein